MKKLIRLIQILVFLLVEISAKSQVQINELMQSNIDCIMDELNDFPDSWVELYNNSDADINLQTYSIGIDNNTETAWLLPDTIIRSHSFIVVYCDKVGSGIHTNFRLESGKGELYLYDRGVQQDAVKFKKQPAPNIAYGLKSEEESVLGYQLYPTPGKTNCGRLCDNLLEEPVFSNLGG